jgi:hypothetical protein
MIRNASTSFVLLAALPFVLTGCGSAMPDDARPQGLDGEVVSAAPSQETDPAARVIGRQVLVVGEGHEVAVERYADGSLLVVETGTLERDESIVGDDVAFGKTGLEKLLRRIDARAVVSPELLVEPSSRPASPVRPLSLPATTLVNESGSLSTTSSEAIYEKLKCDDASLVWCVPSATGFATTGFARGGWHRANAVNRHITRTATLTIEQPSTDGYNFLPVGTITVPRNGWAQVHRLSPTPANFRARVIGATAAQVGVSLRVTEVAPRSQEAVNWCWAASTQTLLGYLGHEVEQCEIVAAHTGHPLSQTCSAAYKATCVGDKCQAEATQALLRMGYKWNNINRFDEVATKGTNALRLEQALQAGPVALYQPQHWLTMSDYREVVEGGVRVKKALIENNGFMSNDQNTIARWERLDRIAQIDGGAYLGAVADIQRVPPNLADLETRISRVVWDGKNATVFVDHGPGITEFDVHVRDAGGSTLGAQWGADVTVPSKAHVELMSGAKAIWSTYSTDIKLPTPIGPWVWYAAEARGCRWQWPTPTTTGGAVPRRICGAWKSVKTVSLKPVVTIGSVTSTGGFTTVTLRADAAPAGTFYRYRFLDGASGKRWQLHVASGIPASTSLTTLPRFPSVAGRSVEFEAQACSMNGCGDWVARTFTTR